MLEFRRIEDRGLGLVAVFREDEGYEVAPNRESLELRNSNLKAHAQDTSVEEKALAELIKQSCEVESVSS